MSRQDPIHEEEHPQSGRRTLLKAVAIAGGAAAATTLLPGSWVKPAVELGVLPAEAAGPSAVPTPTTTPTTTPQMELSLPSLFLTSGTEWALFVNKTACTPLPRVTGNSSQLYQAQCDYYDPLGEFDPKTWTLFTQEEPCGIVRSKLICGDGEGFDIKPDPVNGYAGNFSFYKLIECQGSTGLWWWVEKGDRTSTKVFQVQNGSS